MVLAKAMAAACVEQVKPAEDQRQEVRDAGKRARAQLIKTNLTPVVDIPKPFSNGGLPRLDLVSAGNHGLMHAVDTFDLAKGCKFGTEAALWMQQAIG